MPKPTQAHLDRILDKNQPLKVRQQTLSQMQYYMGAKLIEVGIDPQAVLYRWSVKNKGDKQICILSAFWGDSRAKLLSGDEPLTGEELIDCAKANAFTGLENTAKLCGYATDINGFQSQLKETAQKLGVKLESLKKKNLI